MYEIPPEPVQSHTHTEFQQSDSSVAEARLPSTSSGRGTHEQRCQHSSAGYCGRLRVDSIPGTVAHSR